MALKEDVDQEYVSKLEEKLRNLRNPERQLQSKQILSELKSLREDKLFNLITGRDQCFEDNFVDVPLSASYIQRKIAPHTVAINKIELVNLVKADQLQITNTEAVDLDKKRKVKEKTE